MLKAINTKILLGILAALTAIGAMLVHQNHVNEQATAAAARSAAVLEQQQKDTDAQEKHDAGVLERGGSRQEETQLKYRRRIKNELRHTLIQHRS